MPPFCSSGNIFQCCVHWTAGACNKFYIKFESVLWARDEINQLITIKIIYFSIFSAIEKKIQCRNVILKHWFTKTFRLTFLLTFLHGVNSRKKFDPSEVQLIILNCDNFCNSAITQSSSNYNFIKSLKKEIDDTETWGVTVWGSLNGWLIWGVLCNFQGFPRWSLEFTEKMLHDFKLLMEFTRIINTFT